MCRPPRATLRIDADDFAAVDRVADRCKKQGAPAKGCPRRHDQLRSQRDDQLLVDPEIQRRLVGVHAQPTRVLPGLPGRLVVEAMEASNRSPSPLIRDSIRYAVEEPHGTGG